MRAVREILAGAIWGATLAAVAILGGLVIAKAAWGDTLLLRDSSEGHAAEVFYSNSLMMDSINITRTETHNGVQVRIQVEVNGRGPERITVEPLDPDYIAVPWQLEVEDGFDVTIQIMRAAGLS
jgi:hypothetical protein